MTRLNEDLIGEKDAFAMRESVKPGSYVFVPSVETSFMFGRKRRIENYGGTGTLMAPIPFGADASALVHFDDGITKAVPWWWLTRCKTTENPYTERKLREFRNEYRRKMHETRALDMEFEPALDLIASKRPMEWHVGFTGNYFDYAYRVDDFNNQRIDITPAFAAKLVGEERAQRWTNKVFEIIDVTYYPEHGPDSAEPNPCTAALIERWGGQWRLWTFWKKR